MQRFFRNRGSNRLHGKQVKLAVADLAQEFLNSLSPVVQIETPLVFMCFD